MSRIHDAIDIGRVAARSARAGARYGVYRLFRGRLIAGRDHAFSQAMAFGELLRSRHDLPGMTSFDERAYCRWYARALYSGEGAIVDLGCWLGATTVPLAIGLERSGRGREGGIEAYDLFRWEDWMDPHVAGTPLEGRFRPGDDFSDELRRRVAPYGSRVRVHAVDLTKYSWDGGAIEFLLVDAMKSWELAGAIARSFYPHLIPGRSVVLHQDFAHWYTPWIHVLQYRLRDHFEAVYDLPRSDGLAFRVTKPIPAEEIAPLDQGAVTEDELSAAFAHSTALAGPAKQPNLAAAKAKFFLDAGDHDRVRAELERARTAGLPFESDLRLVEAHLRERESALARPAPQEGIEELLRHAPD